MSYLTKQTHVRTISAWMFLVILCLSNVALAGRSRFPVKIEPVVADYLPESTYPLRDKREKTAGNTTYYVDLVDGDDAADGTTKKTAWKSFVPVNKRLFTNGDRVHIIKPGPIHETLMPMTDGTDGKSPLTIQFAPGRYDVFREKLAKRKFHISNTNNDPWGLKAMAIYIYDTKGIALEGDKSIFFMRGQMIEACVDHSQEVSFSGLSFDYHRPTVSEFRVLKIENGMVDVEIHKDSKYEIRDKKLYWIGEGWEAKAGFYLQELRGDVVRRAKKNPLGYAKHIEELKPFVIRIEQFKGSKQFRPLSLGVTYQTADRFRNCVGVLHQYSKNITWENCNFHFFHGMGVISQFTEDITFQSVSIAPRKESGRTCAAYADLLHFSGCRGQINVFNVHFSGAMDDAINVHGTYLKIIERISDHQIKVKYMHRESFGFEQYFKGDQVDFLHVQTALPYASNTVAAVEQLDERVFLLTLKDKVPENIEESVLENATWTAALHVKDCLVKRIPTRGFLVGTRKKVLIEDTIFKKTGMGIGILVEGSVVGWCESGAIRDMTIRNCKFIDCNIKVDTTAREYKDEGIHKNINIVNNTFYHDNVFTAKHVDNVNIRDNTIYSGAPMSLLFELTKSRNVVIKDNQIKPVTEIKNLRH